MDDVSEATIEHAGIKPSQEVLDADAFVPPEVVGLARWTAEYYAAGPGDTITAVLPPKARGGRADAHKTLRVAAITAAGLEAVGLPSAQITTKQREALQLLWASPDGIPTAQLAGRGIAADVVARLVRHGFVSIRQDRLDRDPFRTATVDSVADPARQLTTEQAAAFSRLSAMALTGRFQVALLHGVTGSGKTELYVR